MINFIIALKIKNKKSEKREDSTNKKGKRKGMGTVKAWRTTLEQACGLIHPAPVVGGHYSSSAFLCKPVALKEEE